MNEVVKTKEQEKVVELKGGKIFDFEIPDSIGINFLVGNF